MDAARLDQFATTLAAASSRRRVIGGLFGAVLSRSRIGVAEANHRPDHHCTPSDQHACPEGQTCRNENGAWTCQDTCLAPGAPCTTDNDCCPIAGIRFCIPEAGVCDNDPGTD